MKLIYRDNNTGKEYDCIPLREWRQLSNPEERTLEGMRDHLQSTRAGLTYSIVHSNYELNARTTPKREVIYVCHPVSGDPIGNCFRVVQWIKWLTENDRTRVYIAPWVAEVLAFPTSIGPGDPLFERALRDDEEVVSRCDGVILFGGRKSPGMAREEARALRDHKSVTDCSRYATPNDLPEGFFLDPAYEG